MDKAAIRWGIISTGNIANKFVKDLSLVEKGKAYAVASRSLEKAEAFAANYHMERAYGSYTDLMQDPEVDIIYIGTPHDSHADLAIQCLNAGKAVLCEKPLAVNKFQVQSIIDASVKNNVFMMEAFWSRFNPSIEKAYALIQEGVLGDVNYLNADFSFLRSDAPESRLLNLDLAGGALLDMGVYPIFLSYLIFGYPKEILALGRFHKTGADVQTGMLFKYDNGIANLTTGFESRSDLVAKIYGTEGSISLHENWHEAQSFDLKKGSEISTFDLPTKGKGFTYEIEECHACLNAGVIESSKWSHQNSLDLISIADEVRRQLGLVYPFE
jgi:predicted dehydrogenase